MRFVNRRLAVALVLTLCVISVHADGPPPPVSPPATVYFEDDPVDVEQVLAGPDLDAGYDPILDGPANPIYFVYQTYLDAYGKKTYVLQYIVLGEAIPGEGDLGYSPWWELNIVDLEVGYSGEKLTSEEKVLAYDPEPTQTGVLVLCPVID